MVKKKVLLMGKAHSGKTSMRSIIFANYLARDTTRLSPTLEMEHHHVRFLGNLVLNLWDCGGQDAFYESYFERDREMIFRGVELLIYVFDIESDDPEKDFEHYSGVLTAIEENSPDARIFVLIHKFDLVAEEERDAIFEDRRRLIEEHSKGMSLTCFRTSIWDETLYKAWSEIVTCLIPNINLLKSHLTEFCDICDAEEIVLFEKATFLVISHATASEGGERKALGHSSSSSSSSAGESGGGQGLLSQGETGGEQHHENQDPLGSSASSGNEAGGQEDPPPPPGGEASILPGGQGSSSSPALPSSPSLSDGSVSAPPLPGRKAPNRLVTLDAHRFEKISNIIKQFKLSCGKTQAQFEGMEVRNSQYSAFLNAFTANTYIMVIVSDPSVESATTLINIEGAKRYFEKFIPRA